MTKENQKKDRGPSLEDIGRRMDEEIEKLVSYINDEVVPTVRQHSTKGLRVAADRLRSFADYMDEKQEPVSTRNPESEEDIGS